jgi:battenin
MYQAGVLVSRSSGMFFKADLRALWLMPLLQLLMLAFFLLDAYLMFFYSFSSLLPLCFLVGLLGGAVYVNGFSLISEQVHPRMREFSLSSASIADSVGIACANVAGIFIQKALYDYHDIHD